MDWVSRSVARPVSVTVAVLLLSLFGVLALFRIPVQLTPDVDVPKIRVETIWPGAGPLEVEKEITEEQERQLRNVEGLVRMTSESQDGMAVVELEFPVGMDMKEALIKVNTRLNQVARYPDDVEEPVISTSGAQDQAIAWFVLKRRGGSAEAIETLHDFCEDEIRPRFERVKGVSKSNVLGGREREMQVILDHGRLASRGLMLDDVVAALRGENANITGGDLDEGKRRYVVRVAGEYRTAAEVASVVVEKPGLAPIPVGMLGDVRLGYRKPAFTVRNRGDEAIAINCMRAVGANVLSTMEGLREALAAINAELLAPRGLVLEQVYDETTYIEQSIASVRKNLVVGAVLAAAILLVFLRRVRPTLIIAVSIPICAVATFLVVQLLGRSLNVVMLAGMSFATGMVVDNAIVVLENIVRRRDAGEGAVEAAVNGALEVRGAIVLSTLTTMAVFVPVIFVEEEAGQLFRDIAIAITAAVGLSLAVALTVVPTLGARLIASGARAPEGGAAAPGRQTLLRRIVGAPWSVAGAVAGGLEALNRRVARSIPLCVVLVAALSGLAAVGTAALMPAAEYLPTGNRNLVFGIVLPPPGYNLGELTSIGEVLEKELRPYWEAREGTPEAAALEGPAIENFFYVARGRGVFMGATARDPMRAAELVAVLERPLRKVPGMIAIITQSSLFGRALAQGRSVDIEITGPDLEALLGLGGRIFGQVRGLLPGAQARPIPSLDLGSPEIRLEPRTVRMAEAGLRNEQLGLLLDAFVDGRKVADFRLEGEEIDLVVKARADAVANWQDLENLAIETPAGGRTTVGSVARLVVTNGPEQVNHVERDRSVTIQVIPPGDLSIEATMNLVRERILAPLEAEGALGGGIRVHLAGTADKLTATKDALLGNFLLAVVITFLLMASLYESFLYPLVVIFSVPLGAVGGLLGLAAVDRLLGPTPFDVVAMLGFVILVGTVVNNAILIVDQALILMRAGGVTAAEAIPRAARQRLRPIFMTLLTTVFGMLPLVISPDAGSELYRGLGAVVLGGLVVSTIFVLLLIPALLRIVIAGKLLVGRLMPGFRKI